MMIDSQETLQRLLLAVLLGSAIGIERQWRQKMVGLRTNALVAQGAAGFVVFAALFPGESSPTRVAAQLAPTTPRDCRRRSCGRPRATQALEPPRRLDTAKFLAAALTRAEALVRGLPMEAVMAQSRLRLLVVPGRWNHRLTPCS